MKLGLYSVYDLVAKTYTAPYAAQSDAIAIRSLLTAVRDPSSTLFQHPHDFRLFKLGLWDDDSGEISTPEPPVLIINVIDLIPTKEATK